MSHHTRVDGLPPTAEVVVKPSTIIKSHTIQLPPVDQFQTRNYTPYLLAFRLDPQADPSRVFWELRCGLSDALSEFPFFAGEIVVEDPRRNHIAIRVSSEDGVHFKYQHLTTREHAQPFPTFNQLEREHFPASKLPLWLSGVQEVLPTNAVSPCLLLQANFIEEGVLLGFSPHHSTSDTVGWTLFLRSWAKHTAAAARGSKIPANRLMDIQDRSPLFHAISETPLQDCPELIQNDDAAAYMAALATAVNATPANVVNSYWYFSAASLSALKASYQPADYHTSAWVSTNDALCALFWRHTSLARQLSPANNASSSFWIPCDIRSRVQPQLSQEYVGNAVIQATFSYPLSELYSDGPGSLYRVASAIRTALNKIDDRKVRSLYGVFGTLPNVGAARYAFDLAPGPDFFISTFAGRDWRQHDWGCQLGKLVGLRFAFLHTIYGYNIVFPRLPDGGLEVFTLYEEEVFERLKADDTFRRYAELRCA